METDKIIDDTNASLQVSGKTAVVSGVFARSGSLPRREKKLTAILCLRAADRIIVVVARVLLLKTLQVFRDRIQSHTGVTNVSSVSKRKTGNY